MKSQLEWATTEWPLPAHDDGIDDRWVQAYAAQRLANVLARLAIGDLLVNLPPMDRAFFNSLAEQTIARAVEQYAHFAEEHHEPQSTE